MRIPPEVSVLSMSKSAESHAFRTVILATILREEEGEIILTRDELSRVNDYSLKVTTISEEGAVVLSAVKR